MLEKAKIHFKYVQVRERKHEAEYFFDKDFVAGDWIDVTWDEWWFLEEYLKGLAEYSDEIWVIERPDGFSYWCEGAKYRPLALDNINWKFVRENTEAIANMASNMLDNGLGVVEDGEFVPIRIDFGWDEGFNPGKITEKIDAFKQTVQIPVVWKDMGRFKVEYNFQGWSLVGWIKSKNL